MPPVLIIYLMSSLEKMKPSLKTAALNDPRAFLRPVQQEKGEGNRVRLSVHCCKWQLIWESRTQQHSGISPYHPPHTGVPESDLPAGQRGPRDHPPTTSPFSRSHKWGLQSRSASGLQSPSATPSQMAPLENNPHPTAPASDPAGPASIQMFSELGPHRGGVLNKCPAAPESEFPSLSLCLLSAEHSSVLTVKQPIADSIRF